MDYLLIFANLFTCLFSMYVLLVSPRLFFHLFHLCTRYFPCLLNTLLLLLLETGLFYLAASMSYFRSVALYLCLPDSQFRKVEEEVIVVVLLYFLKVQVQ